MFDEITMSVNVLKHQPAGSLPHREALETLTRKMQAEGNAEAFKPALPFAIYAIYLCAGGGAREGQSACASFLKTFISLLDADFKQSRTLQMIELAHREWTRDPKPSVEALHELRTQIEACYRAAQLEPAPWVGEIGGWAAL